MESERVKKVMMGRAEIDTRAPFKSVKEAVTLFGEKVLAGELYNTTKLREMHNRTSRRELEETKESLEKAKQESETMSSHLSCLKQELDQTKQELQQLRFERELEKHHMIVDHDIDEDLKFVEDSFEAKKMPSNQGSTSSVEFQKKRYVTFANNPPSLIAQVVVPQGVVETLERHPSLKKKNKKNPLIPLLASIFSRKKPTSSDQLA